MTLHAVRPSAARPSVARLLAPCVVDRAASRAARPVPRRAVRALALSLFGLLVASGARADPFETLERLDQDGFLELSETLAAATHYKAVAPAEALGTLGFDVGIEISSTPIDDSLFDLASDDDFGTGSLLVPRLHLHKGLPFGIDVGAFLGTVVGADFSLVGAEVRFALLDGGIATPAIALRGSYSRVQGSDEIDLDNAALELTISKGFLLFTPYAGAGFVHSRADARDDDGALDDEEFDQGKVFVGANVNLLGFNVAAEVDRTGDDTSVSAKLGFRF